LVWELAPRGSIVEPGLEETSAAGHDRDQPEAVTLAVADVEGAALKVDVPDVERARLGNPLDDLNLELTGCRRAGAPFTRSTNETRTTNEIVLQSLTAPSSESAARRAGARGPILGQKCPAEAPSDHL
jgi:hypothetical protein